MTGQMASVQSAAASPLFSVCDWSGWEKLPGRNLPQTNQLAVGVGQRPAPHMSGVGGHP